MGHDGHRIVAEIANRYLDPTAAREIRALLDQEHKSTLADVASWADEIKAQRPETRPWHYVNIPISDTAYNSSRDCPNSNCVVAKIEEFRTTLADRRQSDEERLEALKFLVHFVGDLHQPLHCSNNGDKGGNKVKVIIDGMETNLHTVWDTTIIGDAGMAEPDFPAKLARKITDAGVKAWQRGTVAGWANESYGLAKSFVYKRLPNPSTHELPADYVQDAAPIVELQLERAGVRLAKVLNDALD